MPPTVGFLVQVIKGTALASVIGFVELTKAGSIISNATFQPFLVYACVALLYFALCFPVSLVAQSLEKETPCQPPLKPAPAARPLLPRIRTMASWSAHPPIVDITALRKSSAHNGVLKGIDMKVARGEVHLHHRQEWLGKSTLLRCVNGLEEFQEGALSVNGKKLLHDNPPPCASCASRWA